MPERYQDERRVTMTITAISGGLHELLDLSDGQIFPGA